MPVLGMDTLARLRRGVDDAAAPTEAGDTVTGGEDSGTAAPAEPSVGDKMKDMIMEQIHKLPCK